MSAKTLAALWKALAFRAVELCLLGETVEVRQPLLRERSHERAVEQPVAFPVMQTKTKFVALSAKTAVDFPVPRSRRKSWRCFSLRSTSTPLEHKSVDIPVSLNKEDVPEAMLHRST